MKIGLFYEDKYTKEHFLCVNFTRSYYQWEDSKGNLINELKEDAWKHMKFKAVKKLKLDKT